MQTTTNTAKSTKRYLSILSDGKFHESVPAGTPGAVVREYELSTGEKGTKTELIHDTVTGKITNVFFEEGQFGEQLRITLDGGDGIVSMSTTTSTAEDFMKKFPNINLDEEITMTPYSFETEDQKVKKGITLTQGGEKINSYYYDPDTKTAINGLPVLEGEWKDLSKAKKDRFILDKREFLVDATKEIAIKFFQTDF